MTGWREVQGSTREEAISEAVRLLGVAESDMEVGDLPPEGDEVRLVVRVAAGEDEPEEAEQAPAKKEPVAATSGGGGGRVFEEPDPALVREQQEVALDFIEELLEAFDLEGEIGAEYRDTVLYVDINGDDLGSLIGRRGATLAALAEVAKTVVQRRTAARVRLHVDVQGYRARRRTALERYATDLAGDVVESGVEKALEPMAAPDRKIVHDAVAKVDGVRSYSEGQEPKRNVVISPE